MVLCESTFSFPTISVCRGEEKTGFSFHSCLLPRCTLPCCFTSPTNITFFHFITAKDFTQRVCVQIYLVTNHVCTRSRREKVTLSFQLIAPGCFTVIYPAYNNQNKDGKLLIALFTPLIGVVVKVISRICVQRIHDNVTHPAYSYVLLVPLYFGSAVSFRVLQADLDRLQSIGVLGINHGAAEVIERSTMVVIDHICHTLWKRQSVYKGSFRTPRRETNG